MKTLIISCLARQFIRKCVFTKCQKSVLSIHSIGQLFSKRKFKLTSRSPISLVFCSKYQIYPQIHTLPSHESPLFSITSASAIVSLPCLAVHLYRWFESRIYPTFYGVGFIFLVFLFYHFRFGFGSMRWHSNLTLGKQIHVMLELELAYG